MMKGQSSTINFDKSYKEAFVQVKEALDPLVCTSPCFLQYFRHFSNYIATFISKRWMKGGCIVTETSQLLWRKCGLVGTKGSWLIYLVTLNSTSTKRSDESPSTEGSWLWMTIYSSDECLWLWFLHCAMPRRWQWAGAPCDLPELNTIPMWDTLFSHREGLPWQWYEHCHISICILMARLSQFRSIINPLPGSRWWKMNQLLHSHSLELGLWGEPV